MRIVHEDIAHEDDEALIVQAIVARPRERLQEAGARGAALREFVPGAVGDAFDGA
ncbi:MAG TPA: hypothetical protein VIP05_32535 [Burkholderiaceae bacterium]